MQITLDVSDQNESTEAPWWIIIDPGKLSGKRGAHELACCIDGPYFSRQEAQDYLDGHSYNYSAKAVVYCHSGYRSHQYLNAFRRREGDF